MKLISLTSLACYLMCGTPAAEVNQNDLVALEKRFELQLDALEKRVETAMTASDKAVAKAELSMEKRMEGMNEFRAQLRDQAGTFVTRNEALSTLLGVGGISLAVTAIIMRRRNNEPRYKP